MNDLAVRFAITVGAASKAVDRSEASGWVGRRLNPGNRRSSLLSLTAAGRRLVDAAAVTLEEELRFRPSVPLGDELGSLASTLTTLRHAIEASGAGLLTSPARSAPADAGRRVSGIIAPARPPIIPLCFAG